MITLWRNGQQSKPTEFQSGLHRTDTGSTSWWGLLANNTRQVKHLVRQLRDLDEHPQLLSKCYRCRHLKQFKWCNVNECFSHFVSYLWSVPYTESKPRSSRWVPLTPQTNLLLGNGLGTEGRGAEELWDDGCECCCCGGWKGWAPGRAGAGGGRKPDPGLFFPKENAWYYQWVINIEFLCFKYHNVNVFSLNYSTAIIWIIGYTFTGIFLVERFLLAQQSWPVSARE